MTEPLLTRYDAAARPEAVILMLHGGTPHSGQEVGGRSASWLRSAWMQRSIAPQAREAGVAVWLLRYLERGWNDGTDRLTDARWALDRVRAEHGDVRVALLGHSMGARVAVHVADDPSVVGVVGLAPWWSAQDPVRTLQGRTLVAAHGRRDRITSFAQTTAYVERARRVATDATLQDMGPLGHYMLTGADQWNEVALTASLRVLEPA